MFLYRQYQLQFNTACCQQPCAMRASDSRTHSRTHTHVFVQIYTYSLHNYIVKVFLVFCYVHCGTTVMYSKILYEIRLI